MEIVDRMLAKDRRALARIITWVENDTPEARQALQHLHQHTGTSHIIGITGPPGTGKSTLVNQLAKEFRRRQLTVGIVAVDPSSPFSGGAILGDRVRMQDLCDDPEIFMRSMATRGALGGLARTTSEVIAVLDAFGKDVVIVETVGVGQDEVDIAKAAHTTVVIGIPGMGDDIQAIKAGVLEIADIYVINKADKEGAGRLEAELGMMLSLTPRTGWQIPILKTIASQNEGVTELVDTMMNHWQFLNQSGHLHSQNAARLHYQLIALAQDELTRRMVEAIGSGGPLHSLVEGVLERRVDPYTAVASLIKEITRPGRD